MNKGLNELTTEELGKLFPIIIEEYNSNWPMIYEKEKEIIEQQFDSNIIQRISHIGSTAIKGIMAKPTIDILIEVAESFDKEEFIRSFEAIKYQYIPQPENPPPHIMLAKGYSEKGFEGQAFHIHVRYKGDWEEILFRDYLNSNPEIAKEYEKLKLKLAKKHKNNREDYTNAKTEFIQKVMKMAENKNQ
jgi:GrpB-like predicted nucleotidyltransferase (UPF0157 family)